MTIYLQNRDMIAAHNARFEKGEVSYSMKMNQFGDMLPEEFEAMQTYKPQEFSEETPLSIGATRDSSPVLKIKDNAEAAGRSLPLVLWKDNISVKPANDFPQRTKSDRLQFQLRKPRMQRRRRPMGLQLHQGQPRSRYRIQLLMKAEMLAVVTAALTEEPPAPATLASDVMMNDLLNAVGSVGPVSVSLYASTQ